MIMMEEETVDDMVMIKQLSENTVLANLKSRYKKGNIYTYINTVLVSLNPYRVVEGLYEKSVIAAYQNSPAKNNKPHIFAMADMAYRKCLSKSQDQVLVISGESGSGKTEGTKLILQYLAQLSGQHSWIEQQLIDSNPILEAFGNAKTGRNDNSSRFGKFIDITFDQNGHIEKAKVSQYLLEKSRIIRQEHGEQNYHIFYWLLSGLSNQDSLSLKLSKHERYRILGKNIFEQDDDICHVSETRWHQLLNALKILAFSLDELDNIFRLLSAILHLGQIEFRNKVMKNADEVAVVKNMHALNTACEMIQLEPALMIKALTSKTLSASRHMISTGLEAEKSQDVRDAFTKGLYGNLFEWIVDKINQTIMSGCACERQESPDANIPANMKSYNRRIGVLDVFGFEELAGDSVCGFEQFCINYANERLQQFFIHHVLRLEQDEYEAEGLQWKRVDYLDNQHILDLIADDHMSLVALINEETIFPGSSDATLCQKLQRFHAGRHDNFLCHRWGNTNMFGIRHFAGDVRYTTDRFLDKNRDAFGSDLLDLVYSSSSPFIRSLFTNVHREDTTSTWRKGRTLISHFKRSLDQLMKQMNCANPFFIRCIRPNAIKSPNHFDAKLVMKQLRYSGIISAIEIRKAGYPARYGHMEFLENFYLIPCTADSRNNNNDDESILLVLLLLRGAVEWVCVAAGLVTNEMADINQNEVFIGRTKVLLKSRAEEKLISWHDGWLTTSITVLQNHIRRWNAARKIHDIFYSVIILQRRISEMKLSCGTSNFSERLEPKFGHINRAMQGLENIFPLHKQSLPSIAAQDQPVTATTITPKPLTHREQTFVDFAQANFQKQSRDYRYSKKMRSVHSLLPLKNREDNDAAIICWELIQTYIHNCPSPKRPILPNVLSKSIHLIGTQGYKNRKPPVPGPILEMIRMAFVGNTYGTIMSTTSSSVVTSNCSDHGHMRGVSKKSERQDSNSTPMTSIRRLADKTNSSIERIQVIIGLGLIRYTLRDEIYCQVMKQITGNPSSKCLNRASVLFAMILTTFLPSKYLMAVLQSFIDEGHADGSPDIYRERLHRTQKNHQRLQPPSYIEYLAAKDKRRNIKVDVILMDKRAVEVYIDPSTNSEELINIIAKPLCLQDTFGFSIFIAVLDKVNSLGAGRDHIFDAVSSCEQYHKQNKYIMAGGRAGHWKLFLRKETFAPWHDAASDSTATKLIYCQICRGIRYSEYRFVNDATMLSVMADIYLIERNTMGGSLDKFISTCMPADWVDNERFKADMKAKISANMAEVNTDTAKIRENLVYFAQASWPLLFSKFYEVTLENRMHLSSILAINSTGIVLLTATSNNLFQMDTSFKPENKRWRNPKNRIFHIAFSQILAVSTKNDVRSVKQLAVYTSISADRPIILLTSEAEDIRRVIMYILNELRQRSKYMILTENFHPEDGEMSSGGWEMRTGDLLILADDLSCVGDIPAHATSINLFHDASKRNVRVPLAICHRLPSLAKPSEEVMEGFRMNGSARPYSLDPPIHGFPFKSEDSTDCSQSGNVQDDASLGPVKSSFVEYGAAKFKQGYSLKYQSYPINSALIYELNNSSIEDKAIEAFNLLLEYSQVTADFELAESIVQIALSQTLLRDECYCHLLKQLNGADCLIENRLWQIMWLMVGCCVPSCGILRNIIQSYLHQKSQNATCLALECLQRYLRTNRRGNRKFPPTQIEFEAIQQGTTQIFHKIFLPDMGDEAFEIESTTRAKDLCARIAQHLGIKSYPNSFGIYVSVADRLVLIPPNDFFFDFLRSMMTLVVAAPADVAYQAMFRRKVWTDVVPGHDLVADIRLHFPQEAENFLSGFHFNLPQLVVIKLAAILFRINSTNNDDAVCERQLTNATAQMYLPSDLLKDNDNIGSFVDDLNEQVNEFNGSKYDNTSLKIEFLRILWEKSVTFGCEFFPVVRLPENNTNRDRTPMLMAVGENGVYLQQLYQLQRNGSVKPAQSSKSSHSSFIHYQYKQLTNWTSGTCFLHLTIGDLLGGGKVLMETLYGYRIDDLLTCYVSILIEKQLSSSIRTSR